MACSGQTDETGDRERSLHLLQLWEQDLEDCYSGRGKHPVFRALEGTIKRRNIPIQPFRNLLRAFVQDQKVRRYATYQDLLGYCQNSANPVGHLVLYLCGYRDEERQQLSDCTCTALQLANFWQDVARDLDKDRIYLPLEDMERFGFSEQDLLARTENDAFRQLIRFQVERTRELFRQGEALRDMVRRRLRLEIDMFSQGGLLVLRMIEEQDYDVLSRRPAISKRRQATLFLRRLAAQLVPFGR